MAQIFNDQRRRFRGYWIYFYPDEYIPPQNKPFAWIHLHFKGQTGEVEIYLKDCRIIKQWGKVTEEEKTKIRKFVKDNCRDIIEKVKEQLKNIGVEWDGNF